MLSKEKGKGKVFRVKSRDLVLLEMIEEVGESLTVLPIKIHGKRLEALGFKEEQGRLTYKTETGKEYIVSKQNRRHEKEVRWVVWVWTRTGYQELTFVKYIHQVQQAIEKLEWTEIK